LVRARDACVRLARYEWSDADHAVVFGAIRGAVERGAALTPKNLIALVTRAGFPDVDVEVYFLVDEVEVETAVETLLKLKD
jgi:hypothetical protein